MGRPTLKQQLEDMERHEAIAKLSEGELIKLLMPHGFWGHIDFWICFHIPLLHSAIWKTVCWICPYDIDTHSRHWRWEEPE